MRPKFRYAIGIDPGVKTGVAIWDREKKEFRVLNTLSILGAIKLMESYHSDPENPIFVRIEDPNQRKWYGENSDAKKQGAGSVKRDFKIVKDWLEANKIPYHAVNPKDLRTKVDKIVFRKITGYPGSTSQHARDAGLMVYRF